MTIALLCYHNSDENCQVQLECQITTESVFRSTAGLRVAQNFSFKNISRSLFLFLRTKYMLHV